MLYDREALILLPTGLSAKEITKINSSNDIEEELRKKGPKYLERYRVYKKYRELVSARKITEAIVPVIGGLPCTGKSSLTREIGFRFNMATLISGDAVRESLRVFISKEERPEFFTSVYESYKAYSQEITEDAVIKGYRSQAKIINEGLQKIIWRAAIKDGEDMTIEYLHFLPEFIDKEVLEHPSVIPIVLYVGDETLHQERVKTRNSFHKKGGVQRILENLHQYRIMQDYQIKQAKEYGLGLIENKEFDDTVDQALEIVFNRIKKLNEKS